ncbi:IclR family transcriptional regulator [Enterobacteriaceae bacterium H11S18]|uniref:IclR family transcriptional regulator n=1 Tax=Dryocola clanedunensis TaxID=2925396 RepID=UPI0022F0F182|nr:IclR family transcriptional regulator [Dryocola clanedunensis]MCT4709415.1 IclR family transcriptional regulator [Dryocola clanedunensis]
MSTLANAKDVLQLIARLQRGVTVTDVTIELGLAKSSASRTLSMMAEYGFLERDLTTRAYRPGPVVMEASWQFRAAHTTASLVEEELELLVRGSGYTGYVNVLEGSDVIVIHMRTGTRSLQVYTPPGSRAPAWASAAGRAVLASLPEQERAAYLPVNFSDPLGTEPQSLEELTTRIAQIKISGWALSRGEYVNGIAGISAAVKDPNNGQRYGFGLAIPCEELNDALVTRWGTAVRDAARRVGKRLGDPFWLSFQDN